MKKEIEITKENYEEYKKLLNKRTEWDSKDTLTFILVSVCSTAAAIGITSDSIKEILVFSFDMISNYSPELALLFMLGEWLTLTGIVVSNWMLLPDLIHEKRINRQFPNLNTKIETEDLRDKLIQFDNNELKNHNEISNVIRKQDLIEKYEQIKKEMLEEYRRDYSSLEYDTNVSEEQLQNITGKVKKLVK